ncbi:MAG TPA: hypothetical protein VNQ76_17520 [Planctomicrobium sp.]|nr:hypothetical protein [Planctomicrobium sp.]
MAVRQRNTVVEENDARDEVEEKAEAREQEDQVEGKVTVTVTEID